MKIRLREDTLRLRLIRTEVETIGNGTTVEQTTRFPNGENLTCRLEVMPGDQQLSAALDGRCITVRIGAQDARTWSSGAAVGIEGALPLASGGTLRVLIEKDFECLHGRSDEPQTGAYPHPAHQNATTRP